MVCNQVKLAYLIAIHTVEDLRVQSGVRKASTTQLWELVGIISDLTYEGVGLGRDPPISKTYLPN